MEHNLTINLVFITDDVVKPIVLRRLNIVTHCPSKLNYLKSFIMFR